ncbi:MAG: alpha/beta hydrolase [Anaerococcus sp.]|nr:alpha/beta hydrolase [Anaerococcus sp.]
MTYLIIILIILPQVYYLIKDKNFRQTIRSKKFYKKMDVGKKGDYKEFYLTSPDGFDIFVREFSHQNPKGLVHIVTGMAEHGGNYLDFAKFLNDHGYGVIIHDHRGHGKSLSYNFPNGHMELSNQLIEDTLLVNTYVRKTYTCPNYIFGHSMGSMVVRLCMGKDDKLFDKIFLTGTVAYNPLSSLAYFFFNILSFYLGGKNHTKLINLALGTKKDSLDFISYSKKNRKDKYEDRLRIFDFTLRYTAVLIDLNRKLGKKSNYRPTDKNLRIYSLVGEDDIITKGDKGLAKSLSFLKNLGYKNITSKVYQNMRHEILNEDNNSLVYEDFLSYLDD